MVTVIKWCILLALVLPVPFILGLIPASFMNRGKQTPAYLFVCGWFLTFCVFEIISVPVILCEGSFALVVAAYGLCILMLAVYALAKCRDTLTHTICSFKESLNMPVIARVGWAVFGVLLIIQIFHSLFYEYYDGDDAYYVAVSVIADTFDTMYLRDAYTCYSFDLDVRHALSPVPIYQAFLSRLSGLDPAIVAHTVIAPVWLLLMYCVYVLLAGRLFDGKEDAVYKPFFMILIALWQLFGNVSLYTAETFVMTRTWQGKGLMAGIVLPALILCFLNFAEDSTSKGDWIVYVCVCVSAVFATSVSFMLIPTVAGIAAILIALKKRSIKFFAKMITGLAPCLVLALLYLMNS